jgi:hypothetical protein
MQVVHKRLPDSYKEHDGSGMETVLAGRYEVRTVMLQNYTLQPGERKVLAYVEADSAILVYAHMAVSTPYAILKTIIDDQINSGSPYALNNYGFTCPYSDICVAKYDTANNIYTVVFRPRWPIEMRTGAVEMENPTASTATVMNAFAFLQVRGLKKIMVAH